ncbi:MAG: hypothetical protein IPK17_10685 [Chloroflexi bacterium]|uniref:hypothetical protein n=1 Tax=Candidatus Flexifilum breve TaxID=3140694 RepID=UPI003134CF0D|nr:hypothetical protein [Chloroflexota bacterium]
MLRRSTKLVLLLCLVFAFVPSIVTAQAEVPIDPAYNITLPDDWNWEYATPYAGFFLSGDDYTVYLVDPAELRAVVRYTTKATMEEVFRDAFAALYDGGLPPGARIEDLNVPGREGLVWSYTMDDNQVGLFMLILMSDESYGVFDAYADADVFDDPERELRDLILSFDNAESVETAVQAPAADSGEPCRVFTDQERTVALRVGPGENRTSVAFLPAGTEVDVTGINVSDDGTEWFQLDKAQAAPQSAASELWMRRGDAEEIGDCDSVGDAAAPPVIPIAVQPPTPAPGGGGGSEPQPPATGSVTPQTGRWTMTLDSVLNASCRGTQNFRLNTNEIYFALEWYDNFVTIVNGGISISGDFFARVPGTNTFNGSFTYDDGTNDQVQFNFSSPTLARGTIITNFTADDGTPCSGTVGFTFSH